jgi:hypothetical protein
LMMLLALMNVAPEARSRIPTRPNQIGIKALLADQLRARLG